MWETLEQRKLLNASVAHELRTPITVIRGYLDYLDYVQCFLETIICEIVFGSAGLFMAGLSNSVVIGYLVSAGGAAWFIW